MLDKTLLEFPTKFPFKVIGKNNDVFFKNVLIILLRIDPSLKENSVETKKSKLENYVSISCDINLECYEKLELLYKEINLLPDLKIAL